MKKNLIIALVIGILVSGFVANAVPQYMNYQGVLRDSAGNLVTGTKAMTFRIYDDPTSTTNKLFEMTSSEVRVSNGLYNVQLGPMSGVDLSSGRRWVEVSIGTDALSPRLEILAVAYALLAASAESVGGYTVASSGANRIPVTDGDGKLSALVIPTTGLTADTANYATLSGTASTAAYVKGQVSAEAASVTSYALYINGGKIGAKTGGAGTSGDHAIGCVGSGSIPDAQNEIEIFNDQVTTSSVILVTGGSASSTSNLGNVWLKVKSISNGSFKVGFSNNVSPGLGYSIPFFYLIIN